MLQIKFTHWFWITVVTGLLFVQTINAIKAGDDEVQGEQELVRRGQSIVEQEAKKPSSIVLSRGPVFTTSKSVSHVRYQVGENQHHQPSRKLMKKKIKKRVQSRKTFLEKIYAKIKEFARITLASRRDSLSDSKKENNFLNNYVGQNNSENNSHNITETNLETNERAAELGEDIEEVSDDREDNIVDEGKWNEAGHESHNVVSFNEFTDGPVIVDTHDADLKNIHNTLGDDIEMSNNVQMIVDDFSGDQGSESQDNKLVESPRSLEARGRSLWPATVDISRHESRGKVVESGNDDSDRKKGLEARFQSFTQERAVIFDTDQSSDHQETGLMLGWTNVIILGVTIATAFAFISVLVVALVYRRSKMENNNCDQFSDIMSTTSRSTASTISSTRSSKSVPDKIDIISFNAEGNLRKSAYNCDDLYSLDSDYFLSSLEDISVQI